MYGDNFELEKNMTEAEQQESTTPGQNEMPFALVEGEPLTVIPQDLYIPPDALAIILEAFEGPLDLLLYLIKRQNLDVLNVSIAEITKQYMQYIDLMQTIKIEIAAEYLVMAAMLAEIKSRMLLPRANDESEEDDPRAELVRRLQEYERFKKAAQDIEELPRVGRDVHMASAELPELQSEIPLPELDLRDLLMAFKDAMARADMYTHHQIQREALSVRERMSRILDMLTADKFIDYTTLFTVEEGRRGVVVTLLAVLELVKESLIDMVQAEPYATIHIKTASA